MKGLHFLFPVGAAVSAEHGALVRTQNPTTSIFISVESATEVTAKATKTSWRLIDMFRRCYRALIATMISSCLPYRSPCSRSRHLAVSETPSLPRSTLGWS